VKLVIIESPYAGDIEKNTKYLRACIRDSLSRGESPIASHAIYPQPEILDDMNPEERKLGLSAGHAWYKVAQLCTVYTDLGISIGMYAGIFSARQNQCPVEHRSLGGMWSDN